MSPPAPEPFLTLRRAGGTALAVPEIGRAALIRLLDCPDLPAGGGVKEVVKAGNTALVLRAVVPLGGGMAEVAWKRVLRKTPLKRWATLLRPRRTELAFHHARRLRAAGVATPRPLAVLRPPRTAVDRPSWLATEWVARSVDLRTAAKRLAGTNAGERVRRGGNMAAAVGAVLGRLHAAGASHQDLKPENLLVRVPPHGPASAWLLDMDAVRFPAVLTPARRRRDLARLLRDARTWPCWDESADARFHRAYAAALSGLVVRRAA